MDNKPSKVILHCSASPDYFWPHVSFDSIGRDTIDRWHKERGFQKIGYHWVIRRSGVIEKGREESEIGAHCVGQNATSIGVCWVGTLIPTLQQFKALDQVFFDLNERFGFGPDDWFPHNAFTNKICPGLDFGVLKEHFRLQLSLHVRIKGLP